MGLQCAASKQSQDSHPSKVSRMLGASELHLQCQRGFSKHLRSNTKLEIQRRQKWIYTKLTINFYKPDFDQGTFRSTSAYRCGHTNCCFTTMTSHCLSLQITPFTLCPIVGYRCKPRLHNGAQNTIRPKNLYNQGMYHCRTAHNAHAISQQKSPHTAFRSWGSRCFVSRNLCCFLEHYYLDLTAMCRTSIMIF